MPIDKQFALEFGLDPNTGDPLPDKKKPDTASNVLTDPDTPRRMASAAADASSKITKTMIMSHPLMGLTTSMANDIRGKGPGVMNWYKGLPPDRQRQVAYIASTIAAPEFAEMGLPAGTGIMAKYGARALASGVASVGSDIATGNKVSGPMAALTGATELPGAAIEGTGRFLTNTPTGQKMVRAGGEVFGRLSQPVMDMAKEFGSKFSEKFPGTQQAIQAASEKATSFYQGIAKRIAMARQASTEGAQKKLLSSVQEEIDQATKNYEDAGKALKKARLEKGIWVDPEQELKQAKIGPIERETGTKGGKHQLALSLESRMPTDYNSLELRYRAFLDNEKMLPKDKKLIEAARLKDAFQDVKHVQGKVPRGVEAALNSHISSLDDMIGKMDPKYKVLETKWSESKNILDQTTERANEALKGKTKEIKPSGLEKDTEGLTPGTMEDRIRRMMNPSQTTTGVSREYRNRMFPRVPGAKEAAGNVAAQALSQPFTSRALYRATAMAGLPLSMVAGQMMGGHPMRGALAYTPTALMFLAATNPQFYRYLLTTSKPFAEAASAAGLGAKALAVGAQSKLTDKDNQ